MKRFLLLTLALLFALPAMAEGDEVWTVENCTDLAALVHSEYPNEGPMSDFATKYAGQMVSLNGRICDAGIGEVRRDIEVVLDDAGAPDANPAHFLLKDVKPADIEAGATAFPAFIDISKNVRVVGKVLQCDDWAHCVALQLLSLEAYNPLLEGLDVSAYATAFEKGSRGEAVQAIQQRLIDLLYLDDRADGAYGDKTRAAVEKFQRATDLDVTGVADPTTQALLFSDNAPEAELSISCSSIVIGANAMTSWYVDGQEFTLRGNNTKTIRTVWGTYRFDAFENYEKID